MLTIFAAAMAAGCKGEKEAESQKPFTYIVDEFADLQILRYQIPDWDSLSFENKAFLSGKKVFKMIGSHSTEPL